MTGEPSAELGRILRYWGGNTKHIDLTKPFQMAVSDTEYASSASSRAEPRPGSAR